MYVCSVRTLSYNRRMPDILDAGHFGRRIFGARKLARKIYVPPPSTDFFSHEMRNFFVSQRYFDLLPFSPGLIQAN
jgi:hypothetical protein